MELFSEIYSCYYQVMRHPLQQNVPLTLQDIQRQICAEGFEESLLSIIPKLEDGTWNLFKREGTLYLSRLSSAFAAPISNIEKAYLKALLSDPRIGLFLTDEQCNTLNGLLADTAPLWTPEQFCYYDRFADGDPFEDASYREHFRLLLQAQKESRYVEIEYQSPKGGRLHHYYMPARLEYSVKNDKFRLLALKNSKGNEMKLELLNIARIQHVRLTGRTLPSPTDLNALIRESYYKEPVKLRIINRRNALERAMLHFANYEKNTAKIDDDTYECLIYYNQSMETELLIEVLSFGPMLTVIGNDRFLKSLRARLKKQKALDLTNSNPLTPASPS